MKLIIIFILTSLYVYSCTSSSKMTGKKSAAASTVSAFSDSALHRKQLSGIDFIITGTEPVSWNLEMDFDNGFSFKALDGGLFIFSPVRPIRNMSEDADVYNANSGAIQMKVTVYDKRCEDGNKRSVVSINGKTYAGCGEYLTDNRLNGKWVLDYINNTRQEETDYPRGLPVIEFNDNKNKFSGHDGCNNMNATMEIQGDRIKFSPIAMTKMACSNNTTEKIFLELISDHLINYDFRENRLTLYLINDGRLIFRRD